MKLHELGKHFALNNQYYILRGCNTSGCNYFQPQLYFIDGDGKYEKIEWFADQDEFATNISDCGFWHIDILCYVPLGKRLYTFYPVDFSWNPENQEYTITSYEMQEFNYDFSQCEIIELDIKQKLFEESLSEREKFVYQIARDCGLEVISA